MNKFMSRKFLITLLVILVAAVKLDGSDLALVLSAAIGSYSLANAGTYFVDMYKARKVDG